jgi:chorismate dehydratase
MRLGYIDYLNCYPFYYHMFERQPLPEVAIVPAYPNELNRMILDGALDMSPVSAAVMAETRGDISLVSDFCLSSVGYIGSVVLRSRVPIENLDGKRIGITRASGTTSVLLKTVLRRYYQADPIYTITTPNPSLDGLDAALLIGNEAMVASHEPIEYSYDLAELWLRKTGFPVVFAVFAVRDSAVRDHAGRIASVVESYRRSLTCLAQEEEVVIAAAQARYPDIIYDVRSYYRLFKFEFNDDLKKALRFYLDAAAGLGFLPETRALKYLDCAVMTE